MSEKTLPPNVVIVDTNEAGSLIENLKLNVGNLGVAKRGDFVRLLLKFSEPTPDGGVNPKATEYISCVVSGRTPSGLLKVKVCSAPSKTHVHTVDYGDDLTLNDRYVLQHESSDSKVTSDVEPFLSGVKPTVVPINAEDAKIRAASQGLPALVPQPGRQYWLRNGAVVTVWTYQTRKVTQCVACGRQLLGSNMNNEMCQATRTYHSWSEKDHSVWLGGSDDGAAIEWNPNGSHAGGMRELDIVKDPQSSEVVA